MAIKPPILMPGDTIGVVTLGSPLEKDVIDARIQVLQTMGFKVVLGNFVYATDGFLAGTDQQRAFDLMQMFDRPEVKLILPSRGGVGVAGILPYLDFQLIQQNPKIISGYSDITVLLNTLYAYADLITFQSLMLIDFNLGVPKYNFDQFFTAVSTTPANRIIDNPEGIPLISIIPGNVTGDIVGGNLTSFIDTIGTPFDIDTKGKILLIEETNEPINTVYRYLNQLKLAGKLDDCIGIIMGQCSNCAAAYGKTYEDLINDFIVPLGKPLMTNLATAHGTYKAAVPIGASVNLDTVHNKLTVLEPTVSAK